MSPSENSRKYMEFLFRKTYIAKHIQIHITYNFRRSQVLWNLSMNSRSGSLTYNDSIPKHQKRGSIMIIGAWCWWRQGQTQTQSLGWVPGRRERVHTFHAPAAVGWLTSAPASRKRDCPYRLPEDPSLTEMFPRSQSAADRWNWVGGKLPLSLLEGDELKECSPAGFLSDRLTVSSAGPTGGHLEIFGNTFQKHSRNPRRQWKPGALSLKVMSCTCTNKTLPGNR